jgi:hypothetical protein
MCYSVQSSIKTTTISFAAIVYLLTSNIPHFQWLGITLIGWCGMQFDELLLWLTEPRKGCTKLNQLITMTLIPFTLAAQPLFAMWGSLYVFPWKTLSLFRKQCMLIYTVLCVSFVSYFYYYKPDKTCTTVTEQGHLSWVTSNYIRKSSIFTPLWFIIIALPLYLLWNKKKMILFLLSIFPLIGFKLGSYTDSQGSIWCFYTSYTSIIASVALFLKQTNIYAIF